MLRRIVDSTARAVESIARHERAAMATALGAVVVLAWGALVVGGGMGASHTTGASDAMPAATVMVFAIWAVMMMAMMLPSAAPTILLFAALMKARPTASALAPTSLFAAGYVIVWVGFAAIATLAHVALEHAGLISADMRATSSVVAAVVLVGAGAYQLTPLKDACLRHCQSPAQFLTRHWRAGSAGVLRLGLLHGAYCVGCCWALMAVLFVVGVMNLVWVGVIAAFVAIEKLLPGGRWVGRVAGIGLVAAGLVVLASVSLRGALGN